MKSQKQKTAITPTREDDYPEWYQQVIKSADLADNSPVRGCMVIKPWGYGIWENMQRVLDQMFKDTGHQNAYFPLFIPLSFFEREAEHVEGFAKECAVVTHHRLEPKPGGGLQPAGALEEPLIVRPTSETIIGEMFANWTQSYRDLPLLINQWANVVRWELRPRMFLRTTEFLWQEGHTAHASEAEAREETMQMLDVYETFARDFMAMPVIKGEKCSWERFPGAVTTFTIEAMMQDRKALQAGTSHFLGQNFARASNITYLSQAGQKEFAWTTSWGVTTRMVGALIMAHGDDDGLVLPPRLAPRHIVILPIYRNDADRSRVLEYCSTLKAELREKRCGDRAIEVDIDDRDVTGGEKKWHHVKRGVPIRLEIGAREVDAQTVSMSRRDRGAGDRANVERAAFVANVSATLDKIQAGMLERASQFNATHTRDIHDRAEFEAWFTPRAASKPEIHGGFARMPFVDDPSIKDALAKLKVSVRCIPLAQERRPGKCVFTGAATDRWAIFAKAY